MSIERFSLAPDARSRGEGELRDLACSSASSPGREAKGPLRSGREVLLTVLRALAAIGVIVSAAAETPDRFTTEIRPLLEQNCLPCHGPDSQTSGLVVTSLEGLLAGGARHGPAVVPGHPERSVLVRALTGELGSPNAVRQAPARGRAG